MRTRNHNEALYLLRPDNRGERAWGCLRCPTVSAGHHGTIAKMTADWADELRRVYPGTRIVRSTGGYDVCPFCGGDQWDEIRIEGPEAR